MALDFTPLAMSEFRNRPGEILDRVSEQGEAFVIERNGRQTACLVPLAVFLPVVAPARIAEELEHLEKVGMHPQTKVTDEREIAFVFRRHLHRNGFDITIVLPHGYPNTCPRVYVEPIDAKAPHRFGDGALCIFGATTAWNPGKHGVSHTLAHTYEWLNGYRNWQNTGKWSNGGSK